MNWLKLNFTFSHSWAQFSDPSLSSFCLPNTCSYISGGWKINKIMARFLKLSQFSISQAKFCFNNLHGQHWGKTQSDQPSNHSPQSNSTRFCAGWAQGFSIKVQKPSVIKSVYLNTKVTLKHLPHDTTASGPSNRFIPTASCRLQTETIQLAFIRQEGVNKADLWLKTFWLWSEPHRWDQTHTAAQCTSSKRLP